MIAFRHASEPDDKRAEELGLTSEEIAFDDAVASNFMAIHDQLSLRRIVHKVVKTLKRNLKVDWTLSYRCWFVPYVIYSLWHTYARGLVLFCVIKWRFLEAQRPARGYTPLEMRVLGPISLSAGCRRGREFP